jgi:formylglycine-generating enzyme required for sulfatase activity
MTQPGSQDLDGNAKATPPSGFLSYSRTDIDAANGFREQLRAAGLDVFKDDVSLRAGDRWLLELEAAVSQCTYFVVLVGRRGIERWVAAETAVALSRRFDAQGNADPLPIFPVLLDDGFASKLTPFLALFQATVWTPGQPIPKELVAAARERQDMLAERPFVPNRCPFRGLTAFRVQDSDLFFGRSRETLHALTLLGDRTANPANPERPPQTGGRDFRRWLQIEGGSGSGKSSLVQAGMLPMIERGALWARTGSSHWRVIGPMMPGRDPILNLAEALLDALRAEHGSRMERSLTQVREALAGPDTSALAELLREFRPGFRPDTGDDHDGEDTGERRVANAAPGRYLLVVDQFEELFTFADDEARKAFDAQLASALADPNCPLFLLTTVRSDFLDRWEQLPRLSELYADRCERYALPAVSEAGLREIIEAPSRLGRVNASEVVNHMVEDARDEPGALALVENALTTLWHATEPSSGGSRRFDGRAYVTHGRLVGMLGNRADRLLDRIEERLPGRGRTSALELLLALTRVDPVGGQHTRRRLTYERAIAIAGNGRDDDGRVVLHMLSGARPENAADDQPSELLRLVTFTPAVDASPTSAREPAGDGETPSKGHIDLVHETLIRVRSRDADRKPYWPALYAYIDTHPERDLLRQDLELRVDRWARTHWTRRWVHLLYGGGWWRFRQLRSATRSLEGRFLRHSRWASALVMGVFMFSLALLESAWWASTNGLPGDYVATQLTWLAGFGPIPEVIALNGGEHEFDMGCKPGRDDSRDTEEASLRGFGCGNHEWERVTVKDPCEMGKHEVTFEQYDYFVWSTEGKGRLENGTYPWDANWGRGTRPVINVSWEDAQRYVQWLSTKTGTTWRLPTEKEWEYAYRSGHDDRMFWWPGKEVKAGAAICDGCDDQYGGKRTAPVGGDGRRCNDFGFCDMAGNVWEWVEDKVGSEGDRRVLRGGSWYHYPFYARADARDVFNADYRFSAGGFRVCRGSPIE